MGGWVEKKRREPGGRGRGWPVWAAFNNKRKEWSAQTLFSGGGEWVEMKTRAAPHEAAADSELTAQIHICERRMRFKLRLFLMLRQAQCGKVSQQMI